MSATPEAPRPIHTGWDLSKPRDICKVRGCQSEAEYEEFAQRRDPMGDALSQKVRVQTCEGHKELLRALCKKG